MSTLRARSVLFCPALRPERIEAFPRSGCDVGVADLEDGVAPTGKAEARAACRRAAESLGRAVPGFPLFVRVNKVGSDWLDDDLGMVADALLAGVPLAGVVVPKVESGEDVALVRRRLRQSGRPAPGARHGPLVLAGIETARGVLSLGPILSQSRPDAVYFGAEDLVADTGGVRSRAGLEVLYARSHVALHARVAGIPCIDQVVVRIDDDDYFREDAAMARSLGYHGKMCLHPRQVPLANRAFSPGPDEIAQAERIVDAYEQAARSGTGVLKFDGEMLDEPRVVLARRVLAAARVEGEADSA